ncbi:MAG TPA: hypothetical protein VJA21_21885 [Verrucomicrobiae bacterium]
MFAYEERWQILPNLALASSLRWLQFVAAYLAWNLLLDELPGRLQRIVAVPILAACLGFLQDIYPGMGNPLFIMLSVGLTLTWTVLALRRRYCESPLAATLAATIIGGACCSVVVMAPSNSALVFLLSLLALPLGALALRNRAWKWRWISLAGIAAVGLVLSLLVPRFLPPEQRAVLLTQEPPPAHTEAVDGVAVSYDDVRVREIARQMAHVLSAANQISREAYGISPEVNKLEIRGFADGGFHAEFPHSIMGNFVSPKQVELSLNNAFLNNDPTNSIDFPDPVNAILHEYSHLYGVVTYQPWLMGAEEEGWATFSATRLSHRLYQRFGPGLWSPTYDYASHADAITKSTLAGRPVYWSHPNEYGGFRLWHSLSEKQGETNLYRARWELTRRDNPGWWLQISVPAPARKIAGRLGFANFVSPQATHATTYGQIYTLQAAQRAEEWLGRSAEQTRAAYVRRAGIAVDPTIRVPAPKPSRLDVVLSVCVLALLFYRKSVSQ